jgi:hypothetical protein
MHVQAAKAEKQGENKVVVIHTEVDQEQGGTKGMMLQAKVDIVKSTFCWLIIISNVQGLLLTVDSVTV